MSITYIYQTCICCGSVVAPPVDYDPEIHTLYCSETCRVTVRVLNYIYTKE